jgi:hypothetical protein
VSRSVVCYAQPDKAKSRRVLEAFAAGCGGRMASTTAARLEHGDVAFYGVRPGWLHLWRQARAEGRRVYYLDNAYFDADREARFRVGVNVVQQHRFPARQYPPFTRPIAPWRVGGRHIVVCPQSDEFMATVEQINEPWAEWVTRRLKMHTSREIRVRKKAERRPLAEDLRDAHALVAHTSAAANEALLAGVPVFVTGLCAASSMACSDLNRIERPLYPDGRERWAAALLAHQWTLDEMRDGACWKSLVTC